MTDSPRPSSQPAAIPADDPKRNFVLVRPDDPNLPHTGLVGDTYTVLLTGKDTAGRYCLIDMHVPPCGGPSAHRHDFEEMFTLLEGEIEFTFRGAKTVVRAGETCQHSGQCTALLPERLWAPRATVMHVLAGRAGRVFHGCRRRRR